MRYEWDPVKARSNRRKHGISFADALTIFGDDLAIHLADEDSDENSEEDRYIVIGRDAFGRLLVVVYTWRGEDVVRLISARRATSYERRQYEG